MTWPEAPPAEDRPVMAWDWQAIWAEERRAKAKGAGLPRCRICRRPMWCGQVDTHLVCQPETKGV